MSLRSLFLVTLALTSCQRSDPQPLEFLLGDPFFGSAGTIAGGGPDELVAYARYAGQGSLRVLRHTQASPGQLEQVADIPIPQPLPRRLFVAGTLLAAAGERELLVYDLTAPSAAPLRFGLATDATAAAVAGRWLLVATGTDLTLFSLDAPGATARYTAPAEVTGAVETGQGSFLAFTHDGYVHVVPDAVAPTFRVSSDPEIRGFRGAFRDGAQALVAGPAATLGRARVARLDLSSPGAPALLRSHEVPGNYVSFAWDGGSLSVIGLGTGPYDLVYDGYLLEEKGGAFSSRGIPLPAYTDPNGPRRDTIAAHRGFLFALSSSGFGFYRLP